MSSGSGNQDGPAHHEGNGLQQLSDAELTTQVAELAGEITEAKTPSRRKKLASQIPVLASRTRQGSLRGLRSGRQAARKGLQSGSGAAARRLRPAGGAAVRRLGPAREAATRGVRATGEWLAGQVLEMAPKVPIRSLPTLQAQYPGRDTEELARQLISGAARASAGIGAAVGVAAAVPFLPTAPVELTVETLALVAIELKLIAELHEVYGMPVPGSAPQRMMAYVGAWANRRGVRITSGGLALVMGSQLRRKLERRLIATAGKSTLSLAPLLTGSVAGAMIDHRETRRLGTLVRDDLRKRAHEHQPITSPSESIDHGFPR
ncbi:MAG: hypothetical protein ACLQFR_21295 [Streptosporangiaceae bacterium]